jgi:hypothetical protein
MSYYKNIPHPYSTDSLRRVRLLRADRHDAHVMESHEDMRASGLKPATRVSIDMECYEFAARQDRYEE